MKNFISTVQIFVIISLTVDKSVEIKTETSVTGQYDVKTNKSESTTNVGPDDSFKITGEGGDSTHLPEGYSIIPGRRLAYKMYKTNVTWDEAREQCISDGGDLAIIDTWDKIRYLMSADSEESMLHVGFHKPEYFGEWMRVDNELPVSWLPWFKKHPPTRKARYCVVILPGIRGLFNVGCWLKTKSVCEISTEENHETNTSAITDSDLPYGYVKFTQFDTAYRIHDDYLTHHEAREQCFTDGGHLAIVDSFEKVRAITNLPKTGPLHVGIRVGSVYFEKWISESDGAVLEDLPWTPNNHYLTKCAALREDGSGLEETLCSNRLQFICEIRQNNY